METSLFENALHAIADGNYTREDIKNIKNYLNHLLKKEVKLKVQMDDLTTKFNKDKNKLKSELKSNQSTIKQVKNILKNI